MHDFVIMVFTLSALEPESMPNVVKKIDQILKKGGKIAIRDYGLYDYSMLRAH
jgi:hypothetical protein